MAVVGFTGTIDDKQFSRLIALMGPRVSVESPTAWAPSVTGGVDRSVTFAAGAGRILGLRDDRGGTFAVAQAVNATGANRIDLIVMRANWTAKTVTPTAITGSSATVPPAINKTLLATGDTYDFPICVCITPNGGGAYSAGDIRDIRAYGGSGGLVIPQPEYLSVHDMVPGQRWQVASTDVWYEVDNAGVPIPIGPEVVSTNGSGSGTVTSNVYTASLTAGTPASVAFTAPPTGRVDIVHNGQIQAASGNSFLAMEVRTGSSIGGGSVFFPVADEEAIISNAAAGPIRPSVTTLVTGLIPGSAYHVREAFKNDVNALTTVNRRTLLVRPAV